MIDLAHGAGSRDDLPIPVFYAFAAAAVALSASFVGLALLWSQSRFRGLAAGRPLPWLERLADARWLQVALRIVGLAAYGYTLAAAAFGPPEPDRNPAPLLLYVILWVGLVPASLLFGPVWRALNPLRTMHRALARLLPAPRPRVLSPRLGYWPSAGGLLLVGRRGDGRLVVRSPFNGLDGLPPAPGLVATICVLLGSTAYDSISGSPSWAGVLQESWLGPTVAGTLGLLATIGVVAGLYALCAGRTAAFAHSLIPVATGYLIAHYLTLLLTEGQRVVSLTLGLGDTVPAEVLTPGAVALIQVGAIVTGHVFGVVAAHDRAVRLAPPDRAIAGQIPLFLLMVCYTCGGLTLLVLT